MNNFTAIKEESTSKDIIWIVAISSILFLFYLGNTALLGPDEPRYAQVAKEMVERNDWITPKLLGHPWFEKPILLYWLMGISYKLFGVTEWAARFPSVLAAIVGLIVIYYTVKKTVSRDVGYWAALVLATNIFFFAFAHAATCDLLLTICILISLSFFHLAETISTKSRIIFLSLFYGFMGIGTLAKGLIGIFIPLSIVFLYIFISNNNWKKRVEHFLRISPFYGFTICLLTASIWYVPVIYQNGFVFIKDFFISHHFSRYLSNKYHHPGPVYFYIPIIFGGLFPWSLFLLPGAAILIKVINKKLIESDSILCLLRLIGCWILVPFIFFSLSGSKLPGYILPVWPALSILIAYALVKNNSLFFTLKRISLFTGIFLILSGICIYYFTGEYKSYLLNTSYLVTLAGCGILLISFLNTFWIKHTLVISMFFIFLLTILTTASVVENKESCKALAKIATTNLLQNEPIIYYKCREYGLFFYVPQKSLLCCDKEGEPYKISSLSELMQFINMNNNSALVILKTSDISELSTLSLITIKIIGAQNNLSIVRVNAI